MLFIPTVAPPRHVVGRWFGCEKDLSDGAVEGEICADGGGAHEGEDAREIDDAWLGRFRLGF